LRPSSKAWTDLGNRSSLVAHGKQPVGVVVNGQDVSAAGMKLFTETDLNAMDEGASIADQIKCDAEGCGHLIISGDTGVWRDVILKVRWCRFKPFETRVESACCQRLKLNCDELHSSFAFEFNLRRCLKASTFTCAVGPALNSWQGGF